MKTIGKILRNILIVFVILLFLAIFIAYICAWIGSSRYPLAFGDKINAMSEKYDLPSTLIAGIVKTESDFDEDVIASDGGMGLMQLMPETAQWCAQQMGIPYEEEKLLDADYNLDMGSFYLSYLINHYQNEGIAIIAYNAGLGNMDEWLADGTITTDPQTWDNVPFTISRNYIKRVRRAQNVYEAFYGRELPEEGSSGPKAALDHMISGFQWCWRQAGFN